MTINILCTRAVSAKVTVFTVLMKKGKVNIFSFTALSAFDFFCPAII